MTLPSALTTSSSNDLNALNCVFEQQQKAYLQHPYPSFEERYNALRHLKDAILQNQKNLVTAMNQDFGVRAVDDSMLGDILTTITTINYTLKHLKRWLKPQKRHVSLLFQPANVLVVYQPLGVVGIMVPWNYPVFLALAPLITAIAAGNHVMLKMSEYTPNTNKLMTRLLSSVFTADKVFVVEGDVSVAAHFSSLPFDHLLFTGSTHVGRLVMQNAAKNLTPVTLELGGKSPLIIADDVDIHFAVARFMQGKTMNAGQTCVAPDYIFCPEEKVSSLCKAISAKFNQMYPDFYQNNDYSSIINQQQYQRLAALMEDAKQQGANVYPCVEVQENALRKLPLMLLTQVNDSMQIMQEEIFGPILPILPYKNIDDAIEYVNQHERPLALYLISHNKVLQNRIIKNTHSGGVCINDTAIQVAQDDAPFGGIGHSGIGQYHGREGFVTFSKAKTVVRKGRISVSKLVMPPFNKKLLSIFYKLFIR